MDLWCAKSGRDRTDYPLHSTHEEHCSTQTTALTLLVAVVRREEEEEDRGRMEQEHDRKVEEKVEEKEDGNKGVEYRCE